MAYNKNTWATDDIITADKLNNLESGLEAVDTDLSQISVGGRNYFITNTATKGFLIDNDVVVNAVNHDMTSDFISVSPNDTWIATGRYNSNASSSTEMIIVFQYYDVNKAVIGARSRNSSGKYVTRYSVTKTIPSGVAYMRVSSGWVDDGYGSFKIEKGNIVTDWTPAPEDVPSNDLQLVHKTGTETVSGNKSFTGNVSIAGSVMNYALVPSIAISGYVSGSLKVSKQSGMVSITSMDLVLTKGATVTLPAGYYPRSQIQAPITGQNTNGVTSGGYMTVGVDGSVTFNSMGFASGNATAYVNVHYIAQV